MKCSELMKTDLVCCRLTDTVAEVATKMLERGVGFVPVCGAAGEVIGTLTDRDLALRVVAARRAVESTLAEEVMSKGAITCRPDDDLQVAERLMSEHRVSRLMCTDERGRLVGVISLSDIAAVERGGRAADVMRAVSEREAHA